MGTEVVIAAVLAVLAGWGRRDGVAGMFVGRLGGRRANCVDTVGICTCSSLDRARPQVLRPTRTAQHGHT